MRQRGHCSSEAEAKQAEFEMNFIISLRGFYCAYKNATFYMIIRRMGESCIQSSLRCLSLTRMISLLYSFTKITLIHDLKHKTVTS